MYRTNMKTRNRELLMPQYRRAVVPGGTFFFTVVTYRRQPLFAVSAARNCLRAAVQEVRAAKPFTVDAWCLLPDHLHCVWTLPEGDSDFSGRWRRIKGVFTHDFRRVFRRVPTVRSASRAARGEQSVWQRRFWEHVIRDEDDFRRHVDYVHYNPVKHGYVDRPGDWRWSTFHRHVRDGMYDPDWGAVAPRTISGLGCAGE